VENVDVERGSPMRKDHVTKDEFESFKEGDFKAVKDAIMNIQLNQAKTDSKIDVLSVEVKHVASSLAEFKRVVCWGAAVFAVPMLFMMYQILCAK
jgi:hypothetical protein